MNTGVIQKIVDQTSRELYGADFHQKMKSNFKDPPKTEQVTSMHLQGAFYILIAGYIVSTIAFGCEILTQKYKGSAGCT